MFRACVLCVTGHYCPVGSTSGTANGTGCSNATFYCPAGSAAPVAVLTGYYGVADATGLYIAQSTCREGSYCVAGEQLPCPPGVCEASLAVSSGCPYACLHSRRTGWYYVHTILAGTHCLSACRFLTRLRVCRDGHVVCVGCGVSSWLVQLRWRVCVHAVSLWHLRRRVRSDVSSVLRSLQRRVGVSRWQH